MRRHLWLYSTAYAAIALVILVYSINQVNGYEYTELAGFLLIALVLSSWQVDMGSAIMPMSETITAAAQLILPTHLVVIIDAFVGLSVTVRRRRQLVAFLFNIANHVVPAYIVGTFYTMSGFRGQAITWSGILVATLVLALRYILPLLTGCLYVAWRDKQKPNRLLFDIIKWDGFGGPSNRVMALLIMLAYPQAGFPTLVLSGVLLLTMRHSYQLYAKRELLTRSARSDGLTEVGNRHAWQEMLAELATRPQGPYVVTTFDLDGMKNVNDTIGHEAGDNVLRSFARHLSSAAGSNRVFRFGGDEFVVLFTHKGPGDLLDIQQLLDRVLAEFVSEWAEQRINISASVGITYTEDAGSITDALRSADKAMYKHKRRNTR